MPDQDADLCQQARPGQQGLVLTSPGCGSRKGRMDGWTDRGLRASPCMAVHSLGVSVCRRETAYEHP